MIPQELDLERGQVLRGELGLRLVHKHIRLGANLMVLQERKIVKYMDCIITTLQKVI